MAMPESDLVNSSVGGSSSDANSSAPPSLIERLRGNSKNDVARMGFMEHLMELRRRLWVCVLATALCMILALIYEKEIFVFMRAPLDQVNLQYAADPEYPELLKQLQLPDKSPIALLITVDPMAIMLMITSIGFYVGLLLSSPILLYQLWAFVAPGLRAKEKRAIRPVLFGGILFFLAGSAIAYYFLIPISLQFFVWFALDWNVRPQYSVDTYLSLLVAMIGISGLIFEIPMIVMVFAKLGLIKPSYLTKFWRPIVFVGVALGAVISPGADITLMALFTALILGVYFFSILMAYLFYKDMNRQERQVRQVEKKLMT
ncbi:MAG: twin-arginine translocase subunit TatC [Planctomycetota bacterium]